MTVTIFDGSRGREPGSLIVAQQAAPVLDRLSRYQARPARLLPPPAELRKLQTNRALRSLKLDQQREAAVPAITEINDLTKQTRSEVTSEALKLALSMVEYETAVFQNNAITRNRAATPPAPTPARQTVPAENLALRL